MDAWQTVYVEGAPRIAVDVMGSGPMVLFLHGIGGNRTNWHPQLPVLAPRYTACAWDARGYGLSDDYEGELDFGDFSDDLCRLLDRFEVDKAHLCGLSFGGRVAQDFWPRHPDRVATLTLCDTHRGFAHFSDEKRREFIRLRKEPLVNGGEPKDIAVPVAKSLAGPNASKESFDALVDSMSRLHKESYIKTIEASALAGNHGELADIRAPTHVIVGSEDRLTTPEMCRELAGMIPGARFTVIEEAGHLVNIEKPAEFNATAIAFVRSAGKQMA